MVNGITTYKLTKTDYICKLPRDLLFPTLCTGLALFYWYKLGWDRIFGIIYVFIICFGLYQYYVVYTHWHHSKNMVIIYNDTTNEVTYINHNDSISFFLKDVAVLEYISPKRDGDTKHIRSIGYLNYYVLTINRVEKTIYISSLLSPDDMINRLKQTASCRYTEDFTIFNHIDN